MSADRDSIYYAPPPPPPPPQPPLLPNLLLFNNFAAPLPASCASLPLNNTRTVVNVVPYSCPLSPEEELRKLRNKLWQEEGTSTPPNVTSYRYIEPILQDGPKCGLVALSMASSCTANPLSVEFLLQEARSLGFTNHGEMFSVDNMASFASNVLGPYCKRVEVLDNGLQPKNYILYHLMMGSLLLVPYDADANHSPCCRRGHKAHWALIVGLAISSHPLQNVYVLARQGKSRKLAAWSYESLKISNENLLELDPGRASDGRCYILPPGGVSAGLQGRALFLHGVDQDIHKMLKS